MTTQQCHSASPYSAKLLVSLFFMRFTGRCCSPLSRGQSPQQCWPLCLFSAALIHQRLLPAEQQVCDLVTRLLVERVSVVATVIGSSYPPITHLFKDFDWPDLPRRRQSKGLWDEIYGPGEKGSLSLETSQLIENPAEFFMKIENFFSSKLSVNCVDFVLVLSFC